MLIGHPGRTRRIEIWVHNPTLDATMCRLERLGWRANRQSGYESSGVLDLSLFVLSALVGDCLTDGRSVPW